MCGIFGLVTTEKSDVPKSDYLQVVDNLFRLSESRGKEATGFITKTEDNIHFYKVPEPASKMIRSKEYKSHFEKLTMPASLIGHSRLVTNGTQEKHDNNQPVKSENIIGVHNGIITNVDDIWDSFKMLNRQYEIDTEIIFKLLSFFLLKSNSLEKAISSTFKILSGTASIATFFSQLNKLLIATNNGSLYVAYNTEKNICVFTSEKYTLKKVVNKIHSLKLCDDLDIHKIEPGYAHIVDLSTFEVIHYSYLQKEKSNTLDFKKPLPIVDITPSNKRNMKGSGSRYFNSKLVNINLPSFFTKHFTNNFKLINDIKRCAKCVLPETFPYINFNENNICNYCENSNNIKRKGERKFISIIDKYKKSNNLPDCIVPFSGGRDSSYGLYYLKNKLGLNPISYTYDWGMVTDLARRNIARMCGALGVENIIVSADIKKKGKT